VKTHLIDQFLAACGMGSVLPLRVSSAGWEHTVVRKFQQPFMVVGKDPRCDLCLNGPAVSGCHAYLQVVGGSVFAIDLQSETTGPERGEWLHRDSPLRIGPFTIALADDVLEEADRFEGPREWNPCVSRSVQGSRMPVVTLELLNTADRQPPRRLNRLLALVGSAPGCNIRLVSTTVSRVHCSLLRTPIGLWAIDLLSGSGIVVNGTSLRYALLRNGDELQVGKFRLRVGVERVLPAEVSAARGADYAPTLHVAGESVVAASRGSDSAPTPQVGRESFHVGGESFPRQAADLVRPPSADLSAVSHPEMVLARREQSPLLPLVQQFHLMQQQMFDQFQQTTLMVVQMFNTVHREQSELVRKELEQVRSVIQEVHALRSEWTNLAAPAPQPAHTPPPPPPKPARTRTNGSTTTRSAEASSKDIHAWLSDRLATLHQERQAQWQKVVSFLSGK
jgi:pSer/pThr/pTyr-binding forkhead associated (FHA) protein